MIVAATKNNLQKLCLKNSPGASPVRVKLRARSFASQSTTSLTSNGAPVQ